MYENNLALYEKIVASQPQIQRKGKANPYTSMNGNMFSFFAKDGKVSIRLSDADRETFTKKHRGKPSIQYGAVMRGYVEVPSTVLKNLALMKRWFARSVAYAETLPAKPTTRKKKAKKKAAKKKRAAKKKAAKRKAPARRAAKKKAAKKRRR